ncbi:MULTISPECIES: SF1B family DNA helicase RecD2 [Gemella]|uniref:SF1B family DNA helicase RecD2 n=1 Tax=Gemella TaxID=1378 RepID=UPI00076827C9|nr:MULTISPECIES: ATP-dependent RecD-like DNA helicase [Gemella]AME09520.1 helicase RecD [Gemella sp. oral taxon 928]AXI27159.1 ATP-dependent RecD-like DNA helicase [Gemella sp. ND 6198]
MKTVEGFLNKIIFHNKENNYYILSIFLNDNYDFINGDYFSVVGTFPDVKFENEVLYMFKGEIIEHRKYGKQLSAIVAEPIIEKDKEAIISYLSSSIFQGIGRKTAEHIVDTLGIEALDKIYNDKDSLYNIKGITKQRKDIIYSTIITNKQTQDVILKLNEYNLSNNLILKIYNFYKHNTIKTITETPYSLIRDIKGINFKTVDKIAEINGIAANDKERILYGFIYTINTFCFSTGNTYIKKNSLLYNTFNTLYASREEVLAKEDIVNSLNYALDLGKLIELDDKIFLPEIYYSEYSIYSDIEKRLERENTINLDDKLLETYIEEVEEELDIKYDIVQIAAIKNSILNNVSILTGGPGTGKTTIILAVIKIFQKIKNYDLSDLLNEHKNILTLCAPTGKAAKRMAESTGFYASTIHKAIGWTNENENMEEFISDKSIKSELVIIDEASMIDVFLMYNLLKIINFDAKIILVGDNDQLPSIAPGNVLNDLINSNTISTVKLNRIFRQSENSSIINISHSIKNNIPFDVLENFDDKEFLMANKNEILDVIVTTYSNLLKTSGKEKIQILAPIYKGMVGINEINKTIQNIFNINEVYIEYGELIYKIDDRVMQLVNRPEDNIFNGDIGYIYDIVKEDGKFKIIINYDENFVTYEKQELNQITLAYASSIHKAQGSEFDNVIVPFIDSYNFMLNKNLTYTAVTRAKKKLILCGNPNVFYKSIEPTNTISRQTALEWFFRYNSSDNEFNNKFNEDTILTFKNINIIDPMIGMNDIKPEDFL